MHKHLLNRRQFSARCAAFGLSFPALSAMLAAQATAPVPGAGAASKPAARTVRLPDGTTVPALGQGCRSEEHTSELQSRVDLVCRLLLEKKKKKREDIRRHTHRAKRTMLEHPRA